jgi:hypothetical protein
MEKQLSFLCDILRNLATSESASDRTPTRDLSAFVTPTSPDFGTSKLLVTIQVLLNPAVDGLYFTQSNHMGILASDSILSVNY